MGYKTTQKDRLWVAIDQASVPKRGHSSFTLMGAIILPKYGHLLTQGECDKLVCHMSPRVSPIKTWPYSRLSKRGKSKLAHKIK